MFFFFFNDTATTEIYTLSLHDALPIYGARERHAAAGGEPARAYERSHHAGRMGRADGPDRRDRRLPPSAFRRHATRSEEHTSELQSQSNLVCRLLLEKKIMVLFVVLLT